MVGLTAGGERGRWRGSRRPPPQPRVPVSPKELPGTRASVQETKGRLKKLSKKQVGTAVCLLTARAGPYCGSGICPPGLSAPSLPTQLSAEPAGTAPPTPPRHTAAVAPWWQGEAVPARGRGGRTEGRDSCTRRFGPDPLPPAPLRSRPGSGAAGGTAEGGAPVPAHRALPLPVHWL